MPRSCTDFRSSISYAGSDVTGHPDYEVDTVNDSLLICLDINMGNWKPVCPKAIIAVLMVALTFDGPKLSLTTSCFETSSVQNRPRYNRDLG